MSTLQKNSLFTLLALGILFFVAACGDDFKNPFNDGADPKTEENLNVGEDAETDGDDGMEDDQLTDGTYSEDPLDSSAGADYEPTGETEVETASQLPDPPADGTSNTERQFRVIIASLSSADAEKLVNQLNDGQAEIVYVPTLDTYRVVYRSFSNLRNAQQSAESIRGRFPGAWIDYF